MLSVQVTPSLAVTMLDALPYLIEYPYGCTEQTMSRLMPSVALIPLLHLSTWANPQCSKATKP